MFLVGGSSRIPLVARLVHERVGVMPTTLDQPETVVARGALRFVTLDRHRTGAFPGVRPPNPMRQPLEAPSPGYAAIPVGGAGPMPTGAAEVTHPVQTADFPQVPAPAAVKPKSKWLPWIVVGSVVVVIAAGVAVYRLATGGPEGKPVAQYDYRFTAPPGWSQIGGDAANREVQLKPDGPDGQDLIAVQERALDYDATAQRDLAISQVRSAVDKAGSAFSGFSTGTSFGGKDVVYYRQQLDGATVDWYVVLKGKAQVSVGCQYPAGDQDTVHAACQQVVSTLAVDA